LVVVRVGGGAVTNNERTVAIAAIICAMLTLASCFGTATYTQVERERIKLCAKPQ
jgi:hypothetical protein